MQASRSLSIGLLACVGAACNGGGAAGSAATDADGGVGIGARASVGNAAEREPPEGPSRPVTGGASNDGRSGPGRSSPPGQALPDLVLDAAYLIDTLALDVVTVEDRCLLQEGCVRGLGERRVLRFGTRTGNVGSADLMLGAPEADNPLWTFDACQGTYDLVGFAHYELMDGTTGQRVVAGAKNGFCIADAEEWAAGSGAACEVHDCVQQGISRGCADNYGAALECQWVDITDVPPGAYELRVTINAGQRIAELDHANNLVRVRVLLSDQEIRVQR